MSRPTLNPEVPVTSDEAVAKRAPAAPTLAEVAEAIRRDSVTDDRYLVDSVVPFGGE